jgi:hypothetical protein
MGAMSFVLTVLTWSESVFVRWNMFAERLADWRFPKIDPPSFRQGGTGDEETRLEHLRRLPNRKDAQTGAAGGFAVSKSQRKGAGFFNASSRLRLDGHLEPVREDNESLESLVNQGRQPDSLGGVGLCGGMKIGVAMTAAGCAIRAT